LLSSLASWDQVTDWQTISVQVRVEKSWVKAAAVSLETALEAKTLALLKDEVDNTTCLHHI
jgi:hypothetical protein